jgi:hypothetical protein
MIRADEIRKGNGQIQFCLTVLATQLQPKLTLRNSNPAAPSFARNEINFSGFQVLAGSLSALGTVGLLLWAIIKLWLFE